jgi:hypothetical protein
VTSWAFLAYTREIEVAFCRASACIDPLIEGSIDGSSVGRADVAVALEIGIVVVLLRAVAGGSISTWRCRVFCEAEEALILIKVGILRAWTKHMGRVAFVSLWAWSTSIVSIMAWRTSAFDRSVGSVGSIRRAVLDLGVACFTKCDKMIIIRSHITNCFAKVCRI